MVAGVEVHLGAAEGEVDGGGGYPGDRREEAFDEPGAAGAAHAFHGEGDGVGDGTRATAATPSGVGRAVVVSTALQQGRLHLGHAPCVQLRPVTGVGDGRTLRVGVSAQVVPGVESGVRDGFDRGAAGVAAYPYFLPRHLDLRRLEAEGRAAMMAGDRCCTFRGRKDFRVQELLPVRVWPPAASGIRAMRVPRLAWSPLSARAQSSSGHLQPVRRPAEDRNLSGAMFLELRVSGFVGRNGFPLIKGMTSFSHA